MTHSNPPSLPVIFVHAKGRGAASSSEIEALGKLGCVVCSHQEVSGAVRTEQGFGRPGRLLRELAERYPGSPVIFLRAGLTPQPGQLEELTRIMGQSDEPRALTLLSNACATLNPFAGLSPPGSDPGADSARLVGLLGPGHLHTLRHWTDHFVLLSASAVECMSAGDDGTGMLQRLWAAGGQFAVPDHLFLHDDRSNLFKSRPLQPWEAPYPPSFGDLGARLQAWMDFGTENLPLQQHADQSATLHITHSWGGGIAHWIGTFIGADRGASHFQLRAEGPESDRGCGQRLALYAENQLACPLATWWLQPPVRSIEDHEPEYRALLEHICRRYRIGRIIVSSLIGHTLDVLRTGLPTVQVLHDHFPLWPLLSAHPGPWLREREPVDIAAAMDAHRGVIEFPDKDPAAWSDIRGAYVHAISKHQTGIAAPGQSVLDMQARLDPEFDAAGAHVIPHGDSVPSERPGIAPRSRSDGRMRMVVLGRIQPGKGQKLLSQALDAITPHVQVYLLGSGKSGEYFFGQSGVDVIPEYEREELPAILEEIGPHFASLLSIVPETFSFTLSELQWLGIPAIATRVGSFPDRIVHGETGWLIDTRPESLVRQVAALCASPTELEAVRERLASIELQTPEGMVSAYNSLYPRSTEPLAFNPVVPNLGQTQSAAAQFQLVNTRTALASANQRRAELREELEERTEQLGREFEIQTELNREIEVRTEWALDTRQQLEREHEIRTEVEETLASTRATLSELEYRHQRQSAQLEQVLGSTSWKITRPLRAARRVVKNLMLARAWNPLRWPRLLSNVWRNISRSGLGGALQGLQYGSASVAAKPGVRHAAPVTEAEPPECFPEIEHPDVSIVIPVYNNWGFTAACLRSLHDTQGKYSFELIVVDDGSSDESESRLSAIGGLCYLRNDENLGFVGSCNRGAASARGKFLVLLNNDTEVTEGWLDTLIDTLRNEPGAGLVGSRLVYPDGSLQESGGIIYADGSGWNYGRDESAENPSYNYLREADYCSGAAIAMETSLFNELGRLDERYAPAYYEDTDLAFRVREAGLKVFVQPASTVIHHEGVTSGTDTSSGVKKYQVVNQAKFVERWGEALKNQPQSVHDRYDHEALRAASRHRASGSVLVIGQASADDNRLASLLHCCRSRGFSATLLPQGDEPSLEFRRRLQSSGVEVVYGAWLKSLPEFLADRGPGFTHVVIGDADLASDLLPVARRSCTSSRIVVDMQGVHVLPADGRQGTAVGQVDGLVRHAEMALARQADAVLVAGDDEQRVFQHEAPGTAVCVFEAPRQDSAVGDLGDDCDRLAGLLDPPA